jgi:hypothetical protein
MGTSLALDSKGCPHISYNNYYGYYLKYARWNGNQLVIQKVQSNDFSSFANIYTSLALGPNDIPHISFKDDLNNVLKYAHWSSSE